jgi:hypothetical protein
MKKTLLSLLFILTVQISFSQSYKILNSANGKLANFESLTDGDDLFGYAELRKIDLEDKFTEKYKYIILDKNMNTICSGEFTKKLVKRKCENSNYQIVYNNGHIMFLFQEYFLDRSRTLPVRGSYEILNIESNKIITAELFDKKQTDDLSIPKLSGNNHESFSSALSDNGFLIQSSKYFERKGLKDYYYAVDFKGNVLWEQVFKTAEAKHDYEYSFFDKDNTNLILLVTKSRNEKKVSDHLLILDVKTGKEISFTDLSNENYTMRFSSVDVKEGKIYVIGRFFEKEKRDRVDNDESLGLYRRIIEVKSGKIIDEDFLTYDKFKNPNINENGRIKKEGYLSFKKININPDGSYFIIAETYINKSGGAMYNELYAFTLDKDFKPIEMKGFDVNRTRGSKYSFSQELPNKVGKAYFFYDKNEDKDLELNILKYMYASKTLSIDKMKLNNEKSDINVVRAKTGYIGILEHFKNPKKDEKALEIRLEKLNYERQ